MVAGPMLPALQHAGRLALKARGFASRRVELPNGRVHVFDAKGRGTLPTVVVLHGIGSAAVQFARLLVALRPHVRRVLAPDLPGHGFSDESRIPLVPELLFVTVRELLERLTDEPIVLVGNSL